MNKFGTEKSWICSKKKLYRKSLGFGHTLMMMSGIYFPKDPFKTQRHWPDQTKLSTLFSFLTTITVFRFHMKDFVTSARKKFKSKSKSVTSWQCQDFERLG